MSLGKVLAVITQQEAEKLARVNGEYEHYNNLAKHFADLAAKASKEKMVVIDEIAGKYDIREKNYNINTSHREIREGWT